MIKDKEVEDLIKDLKKIGINGFLVTSSNIGDVSEKEKVKGK